MISKSNASARTAMFITQLYIFKCLKINCDRCDNAFVVIFFKTLYNKTIIRFGFCDILNNQGRGKCYQPKPKAVKGRMIDRIAQFGLPRALPARVPHARLVIGN